VETFRMDMTPCVTSCPISGQYCSHFNWKIIIAHITLLCVVQFHLNVTKHWMFVHPLEEPLIIRLRLCLLGSDISRQVPGTYISQHSCGIMPISVAVLSKVQVWSRLTAGIVGLNPVKGHGRSFLGFVVCCVGSSFCNGLITHSKESYKLCVCVCVACALETSKWDGLNEGNYR